MVIKQRVQFKKVDENSKVRRETIIVSGRTTEQLNGRVEKLVNKKLHLGWELR